jgi:hypothetical protein
MNQPLFVNSDGLFDLAALMQTNVRRVPRRLRDELGYTTCATLVAKFGDPAIDPRSGGVIGHRAIAKELCRSPRQVQRIVYNTPLRDELRWAEGIPACAAQSLDTMRDRLDTVAREAHLTGLGRPVGH